MNESPKEKATMLINYFISIQPDILKNITDASFHHAILCSLNMVEEIIDLDDFSVEGREYHNKVKQELEAVL